MFIKIKTSLFWVIGFFIVSLFINCSSVNAQEQPRSVENKENNVKKSNESSNKKLTVMVYCDADNDLEPDLLEDIEKMKKGYPDNPDLNLIVLIDRTPEYSDDAKVLGENFSGSRLYKIETHSAKRIGGGTEFPEITTEKDCELNMGDAGTLKKFVDFCKSNYTSDRYVLIMSNHGGGARDDSTEEDKIRYKAICYDDSHMQGKERDCLYTGEISDVLTKAESVDLLVFDACFMGTTEVAYQYRPGNGSFEAKGMVASAPKATVSGLNYEKIFSFLNKDLSTVTNDELGALFVKEQKNYIQDIGLIDQSLSYLDLSKVKAVKDSIDDLSKALWKENKKSDVEKLRGTEKKTSLIHYFKEKLPGNWVNTPYFDLYDLCKHISLDSNFSENIQNFSLKVMSNVDDMIVCSFGGRKYEGFTEGKNGVSIFLPDGDKLYKDVDTWTEAPSWQFQKWYNSIDTTKLDADYYYGKLKWCEDGQDPKINTVGNWFELLDCWFDKINDEKGGVNGYQW